MHSSICVAISVGNHKGAIALRYIGMMRVGQHYPHIISHFHGDMHSIRNPSSQKGTYGQNKEDLKMTKIR